MRGFGWPPALSPSFWTLKRSIILIGSLATIVGSLGNQFYVDPMQKRSSELDGLVRQANTRADVLRSADTQYWSFQAQNSTVFGLVASDTASEKTKDNMLNLHRLSIANRRRSMIPIVGALATAGEVDYRATSDRLQALARAEQADFSWETYSASNDFERDLVQKAERRVGTLQNEAQELGREKAAADVEIERRKLLLLTLLTIGSTFLLVANLVSSRRDEVAKEEPPPAEQAVPSLEAEVSAPVMRPKAAAS